MFTITNPATDRVKRLSLARRIVVAASIASLALIVPAYAVQVDANGQPAHDAKSRAQPLPRTCAERVTDDIQAFTDGRHKLTPEHSFRLAVLKGNMQRVGQTYSAFESRAANGLGPWANSRNRIQTLQVALDDAALADRPKMIERLVGYGADPNLVTKWPTVPAIMVAAQCGNIAAMNMLYKHGADPSIPAFGDPPANGAKNAIEVAVQARQNTAVLWLLHHGVDVCSTPASKRIALLMKYPIAKGQLSNEVLDALHCRQEGLKSVSPDG